MKNFSARTAGCLLSGSMVLAGPLLLSGCDGEETRSQQVMVGEEKVLSGHIMYRERMALPPGATVTVTLADVSRADAPAITIAEQHIDNPGAVPIPFELRYQAEAITHPHPLAYAVRGEIRGDEGALLWTTTQRHSVELGSRGAQEDLTILLERVAGRSASVEQ